MYPPGQYPERFQWDFYGLRVEPRFLNLASRYLGQYPERFQWDFYGPPP